MKRKGFTLIELLIVVAIIAILAAIAVPNFLEAQARSKVARAKADIRTTVLAIQTYMVDYNTVMIDNHDLKTPSWRSNWTSDDEVRGSLATVKWLYAPQTQTWMQSFYTRLTWVPITTPVAYLTSVPMDPFAKEIPMGFDTREISVGGVNTGKYAYVGLMCAGPDNSEGNWYRDLAGQNKIAIEYDPTNGTTSLGDVTRCIPIKDPDQARKDMPFGFIQ